WRPPIRHSVEMARTTDAPRRWCSLPSQRDEVSDLRAEAGEARQLDVTGDGTMPTDEQLATAKSGMLDLAGARIAYVDAGAGAPPVLFVHGWGGRGANFAPQVAHFSAAHRVVALDRRGHGSSTAPEQEYTITGAADDLAAVCRELGLDRALVVQHS